MKKLAAIGAAISAAALAPSVAIAQAAPTTISGMVGGVDITDTKSGVLAAGGVMLGLAVLTMGIRWVRRQFS
jgi:hypothetical protein